MYLSFLRRCNSNLPILGSVRRRTRKPNRGVSAKAAHTYEILLNLCKLRLTSATAGHEGNDLCICSEGDPCNVIT